MSTHARVVAIVEDDAAMRKSIERLLRASGYETVAFASAEEILHSGVAASASALVLDIHLGGMSGIQLRHQLLAMGTKLPVVFITAYEDETMRAEALAEGCIDYLQKPFEPERLFEALERATGS